MAECKHFWMWFQRVISGKKNGVAIVRQCELCKLKQVAHVPEKQWVKATGDYARDEHYA